MADEGKSLTPLYVADEDLSVVAVFERAHCLMYAEVAIVLEKRLKVNPESILLSPVSSFEKVLEYVKKVSKYPNPDAVRKVRVILQRNKLNKYEAVAIGNLCPLTAREAKTLVPSLARKRGLSEDRLRKMLDELTHIKTLQ